MSAPVQPVVHTPGPWEVKGPSQNGHCRRIFAGDEYVAIVGGSDQPMATIRANADLVADAPAMLALIEELADHMILHGGGNWRQREKAEEVRNRAIDMLNKHGG